MRVGFIGLGNIGGRCAVMFLPAGHELTVADLDETARRRFVEAGAVAANSAAGVATAPLEERPHHAPTTSRELTPRRDQDRRSTPRSCQRTCQPPARV